MKNCGRCGEYKDVWRIVAAIVEDYAVNGCDVTLKLLRRDYLRLGHTTSDNFGFLYLYDEKDLELVK